MWVCLLLDQNIVVKRLRVVSLSHAALKWLAVQCSGDVGFANAEAQCAHCQDIFCSFFPLHIPSPRHWPDWLWRPEAECPVLLGLSPLLSYHSTSSHVGNKVLLRLQILLLVGRLKHVAPDFSFIEM